MEYQYYVGEGKYNDLLYYKATYLNLKHKEACERLIADYGSPERFRFDDDKVAIFAYNGPVEHEALVFTGMCEETKQYLYRPSKKTLEGLKLISRLEIDQDLRFDVSKYILKELNWEFSVVDLEKECVYYASAGYYDGRVLAIVPVEDKNDGPIGPLFMHEVSREEYEKICGGTLG